MSYAELGLNSAVDGVAGVGLFLAPCIGDPLTTGATIDDAVTPLAAAWPAAAAGEADSVQVEWDIPSGGGARTYDFFAVITTDDGLHEYVTGGSLDQEEVFSDNGGTLRFTGTLTAEDAPAV